MVSRQNIALSKHTKTVSLCIFWASNCTLLHHFCVPIHFIFDCTQGEMSCKILARLQVTCKELARNRTFSVQDLNCVRLSYKKSESYLQAIWVIYTQFQRYGLFRLIDHSWSQGVWITEVPLYNTMLPHSLMSGSASVWP